MGFATLYPPYSLINARDARLIASLDIHQPRSTEFTADEATANEADPTDPTQS